MQSRAVGASNVPTCNIAQGVELRTGILGRLTRQGDGTGGGDVAAFWAGEDGGLDTVRGGGIQALLALGPADA